MLTKLLYWLKIPGDASPFRRHLAWSNVRRMRLLATTLVIAMPLLSLLDFAVATRVDDVLTPAALHGMLAVRGAAFAFAVAFLLACRVRAPEAIRPWHSAAVAGFGLANLLGAAAAETVADQVLPGLGIYVVGVFLTAAFVRLPVLQAALLFGVAWAAWAAGKVALGPQGARLVGDLASGTSMTLLGMFVVRILTAAEAREFVRQHALVRQNEDVARANATLNEANERLRRQMLQDSVTKIPNRRYLDEALVREWEQAAVAGAPVSAIMVDIDWFKAFNDSWGHPEGDRALALVAGALARSLMRPADLVARYGGEEFLALLPGTTASGAMVVARRMKEAVRALRIEHPTSRTGVVTVSLGVAEARPAAGGSPQALATRADAAMYRAKSMGRDRVCSDAAGGCVQAPANG